jgi:two-component system phosphate regulon sensor histidine kinase PhoR
MINGKSVDFTVFFADPQLYWYNKRRSGEGYLLCLSKRRDPRGVYEQASSDLIGNLGRKGGEIMHAPQRQSSQGSENVNEINHLNLYKFMIHSLPIAIVALNSELRITEFNPWAEKITGYSAKEAIGRYCGAIFRGGMCNIDCPLKSVISRAKPFVRLETTIHNKLGEVISVRMSTAGLFDEDGELIGALEALQDISYIKALEREKANLISMFAHDIKSSLTGMHGLGIRLLMKSIDMDQRNQAKHVKTIVKEAAKLGSLVDDFLEFSRLQTGKLKLNFSDISLDKELFEVVEAGYPKASERGVKLELQIDENLPVIKADANRLRRVFANLLDNAIKFSKEGGTVTVAAKETPQEIMVNVIDEGIGMDPTELPYIFDIFHRGEGAEKRKGYGIGLAIVKAVVEGHGGRVIVASELDKGSVFTAFLSKETQPR